MENSPTYLELILHEALLWGSIILIWESLKDIITLRNPVTLMRLYAKKSIRRYIYDSQLVISYLLKEITYLRGSIIEYSNDKNIAQQLIKDAFEQSRK